MDCSFSRSAFSLLRSSSSFFASLARRVGWGRDEMGHAVCGWRGGATYSSLMSSNSLMRPRRLIGFFAAAVPSVELTGAGGVAGVDVVVVPSTFAPGLSKPSTTCRVSCAATGVLSSASKACAVVPPRPSPCVTSGTVSSAFAVPAPRPSASVAARATRCCSRFCVFVRVCVCVFVCVACDRDPIVAAQTVLNLGQCLGNAAETVAVGTPMPECIVRRVKDD